MPSTAMPSTAKSPTVAEVIAAFREELSPPDPFLVASQATSSQPELEMSPDDERPGAALPSAGHRSDEAVDEEVAARTRACSFRSIARPATRRTGTGSGPPRPSRDGGAHKPL